MMKTVMSAIINGIMAAIYVVITLKRKAVVSMRFTETELLNKFPSFNYYVDPVATWYGDKPAEYRNLKWYEETVALAGDDDTMCNIFGVDWYVYKTIGEHKVYKLLTGNVGIRTDVDGTDEVMYGDLAVKYGLCTYNIYYNNIYGKDALTIYHNGSVCTGWRNENGNTSPSKRVCRWLLWHCTARQHIHYRRYDRRKCLWWSMGTCVQHY